METARSEITQIATANVLNNADFVKRLVKGEPSRAAKILAKIVQIENALAGGDRRGGKRFWHATKRMNDWYTKRIPPTE